LTKRRRKRRGKNEETKLIFKVYFSETPGVILLQFGMWGTDGRGHLYSKNHLVS